MKYEQAQMINAGCLQYYRIKHFVGRVIMTQSGRNLKFLDRMISQRSPFSSSHLGKILVHPDWISGLNYQHGILQILSAAGVAPAAAGVSSTYVQIRNKPAETGSVSRKSLDILQRLYCP